VYILKGIYLLMVECPACHCIFELQKLNCIRCGHSWFKRMDRLPKVCSKCKSPYWNKSRIKRKVRIILFPEFKEWIDTYKRKLKCSKCGFPYHPSILQFHHLNKETKNFSICDGLYHTKQEVEDEIKKCVVICSNCHHLEHNHIK